jgi:DNA-binding transcriptional ArsR family regulator
MNGPSCPLRFVPLAELIDSSPAEPDWVWRGYLAPSVITLLAGRPKVGKSTLLFELMAAVDRGSSSFCGLPTRRVPVALLSEERMGTVADKAQGTSWTNSVTVLLHHTAYGASWAEIVRQAAGHVGSGGLLIVDTLADFAGLPADSENNAGAIQSAMRPLQEAAASECAVLLVTHQRKAAGDHGEAVRGSNALTAAADIVLELERAPSSIGSQGRVLHALSRFGSTPSDIVVSRSQDGYEAIGELAGATAAAELDRLASQMADFGEATVEELAESVGLAKGTVHRRLSALLAAGRATRTGGGKRGDAFRWRLVLDSPEEIPYGRIEIGRAHPEAAPARLVSTQRLETKRVESRASSERSAAREPDPQAGDAMAQALADIAKGEPRWLPESGPDG